MEKTLQIPITINKENWTYWWEAKIFPWCFSEGETLKEYWDNMTEAIWDYTSWLKEWFFESEDFWILNINLGDNGRIKGNFLKMIDKNSYKSLSWSKTMKI